VLAGFPNRAACRGKTRRPPSPQARAEAARLRRDPASSGSDAARGGRVLDFAAYAAAVRPITGACPSPSTADAAGTVEDSL
jgi:hypothetical protein